MNDVGTEVSHGDRDYTAAVYGSILVTTLLAIELRFVRSVELIAASLLVSVGVFWLTHSWARIVNRRVRGRADLGELASAAGEEAPMLAPAIVPALLLGLARFNVYTVDTAVALALVVGLVQLFLWGVAVGRAAHDSWPISIGLALVDLGLGLLLVVLEVAVLH